MRGVQDVPVLEGVQVGADLSLSPTSKLLMGRKETLQQEGSALEREMVNYEKRFGNPGTALCHLHPKYSTAYPRWVR